jgi:cytochrome c-type biogenesis protein CcmH
MMILFWLIAVAMLALSLFVLLRTTLRQENQSQIAAVDTELQRQNLVVAQDRLADLEAEHARGELSDEEINRYRDDVKQMLANDLHPASSTPDQAVSVVVSRRSNLAIALTLALLLPAITLPVYLWLGSPNLVEGLPMQQLRGEDGQELSLEEMLVRLEQRLQEDRDNLEGWIMLARSAMAMDEYPMAARAYEEILRLTGESADVLLPLADSLAMAQGGTMLGRPAELIMRALELDPDNWTALWLAGHAAEEQGDTAQALAYWYKARQLLADSPEELAVLVQQIGALEARSGIAVPADGATPSATNPPADAVPVALRLAVSLSPELQREIQGDETLFIFARAVNGPPMPLAAVRRQARDLPLEVTLDDSQAMIAGHQLSTQQQVHLSARISRSGQPTAQSGDLFGELRSVDTREGNLLLLVINQRQP